MNKLRRVLAFPLIRLLLILLLFGALITPLVLVFHPPLSMWRIVALNWTSSRCCWSPLPSSSA